MLIFYVITECHISKQRINPGVHCESYRPLPNKETNNTVANIAHLPSEDLELLSTHFSLVLV